jgi:leucyl-tRNA synthetase
LGYTEAFFFAAHKDVNRKTHAKHFLFELLNYDQKPVSEDESGQYEIEWQSIDELKKIGLRHAEAEILLKKIESGVDVYPGYGVLLESNQFSGLSSEKAQKAITKFIRGQQVVKYRLRDWVFSRQRYWGEPIPIIHCPKCGLVPVPEKDLPVKLPKVKSYAPTGTGESPLANIKTWVNVKCPVCKSPAKRETNTMPQWAGSSWYYLRYVDPENDKALIDKNKDKYWSPVDMYVGGTEHATRHLIYARFWHKFLQDIGVVNYPEPFAQLKNQGLISGADGRKMSKRWGNVINPDDVVRSHGADTLRVYEMFMGPFEQGAAWSTDNLMGARRFVEKVWRLSSKVTKSQKLTANSSDYLLHKTIKQVTEDISSFNFNTAVSALMILTNDWEKRPAIGMAEFKILLKLLAPLAPHLAEELWYSLGEKKSVHLSAWPVADHQKLIASEVKIVIQISGKVRAELKLPAGQLEENVIKKALGDSAVQKWLPTGQYKKAIYIKDKLINFVV